MKTEKQSDKKPASATPCFLTTATVGALGMPDDCEPLELARFLRDDKMKSEKDISSVDLYYKIAPVIVARSTDDEWVSFWSDHMRKITALIKLGEYDLAKDLYTYATASLINKKATHYTDKALVDEVYDYGLKGIGKTWMPYSVRYALLKAALFVGLSYQAVRLGISKRKFSQVLDL
ncbi:hypothetical protein ACFL2V_01545 [Pseudomonadota bacterium]